MKNIFSAALAVAVAQAIDMQVEQVEGCSADGDISQRRSPNQFVRIDSAWGPDRGEDWYDDTDCIPMTDDEAYNRGCFVGTWYGQEVP